ncbi:hypothetical protein [Flavobacterium lacisediminis]|uniref:DUF2807 domain-containing protein n=1 Tax=Flavobacterium lacisediminis TaxID=2989705 RepID=A0ABT3EJ56_9FLAO|nr:hypothetical protein [Flavobacterium lacisediminis]MCW1148605.1 hypothetical protein [Flavobacterium lacisediminis]
MKKLIVLVASVFMLQACDDGDITLESFNFDSVTIQECTDNNLIFKINNDELLLINIPESSFANVETPDGSPRIVNVTSANQIIYRIYSGNVTLSNICSTIPPATPVVKKEWIATGGTIEIITDALYAIDGVTITGYTHNIKFVNVNFSGSSNSFSFTEYNFGNYETDL